MTTEQLNAITVGTPAAIRMGERSRHADVVEIKRNADGTVRRVALRPFNTDHTVWFTPDRGAFTGTNGNRAFLV